MRKSQNTPFFERGWMAVLIEFKKVAGFPWGRNAPLLSAGIGLTGQLSLLPFTILGWHGGKACWTPEFLQAKKSQLLTTVMLAGSIFTKHGLHANQLAEELVTNVAPFSANKQLFKIETKLDNIHWVARGFFYAIGEEWKFREGRRGLPNYVHRCSLGKAVVQMSWH